MSDPSEMLSSAVAATTADLSAPGDWLSGAERLSVWAEARGHAAPSEGVGALPSPVVDIARKVAFAPGELDRSWAMERIAALGGGDEAEGTYVEAVGVVASAVTIDRFAVALGTPPAPLGEPRPGEPARARPDGVGDVGAWVAQSVDKTRANVSRTLSLVPVTEGGWRRLVDAFYSRGAEFVSLRWDRALSRAQVELVAARVTALHECFY